MKCIPELYKQLMQLSRTINQCNFISYEDKKDLVYNTILTILEKYNKGILVDDFNEIKGYSFMMIRNSCIGFKRRNRVSYFDTLDETPQVDNYEEHEEIEYLHEIINNYIQHPKYTDEHKQVCELLMQNKYDNEINEIMDLEPGKLAKLKFTMKVKMQSDIKRPLKYIIKNKYDDEINELMNLEPGDLRKLKFTMKNKMKSDVKRPLKYIIKNRFDGNINIPCYKRPDIKEYFGNRFSPKQISSMMNDNIISCDGYYIEKQINK